MRRACPGLVFPTKNPIFCPIPPRFIPHHISKLFDSPQVRDFCRERGLRYPALDESGEIASPADWYARVREGTAERWRGVKL